RVLENGEYSRVGSTQIRRADVRIVAATNRELADLVEEGKVRRDFLYRLNVVEVRLPPLRERRSDLPLLIRHFLEGLGSERRGRKHLSREAEELLLGFDYPGNIRELHNVLHRAVLLSEGPRIEAHHLPESLTAAPRAVSHGDGQPDVAMDLDFRTAKQRVIETFERDYVTRCLREAGGNISQAARRAGIDYKNFYTKMQQYAIDPVAWRS
ncbi:MAG TPA: sigma 54-interacting transcriptional regulator, partial [Thermoanaerobaculia bacterium]|nr:sigma 54-interacting transcriptional regulator [Thermoanaerobaculia bacterium]